jgi:glucosamine-6-phosphate deaminase
MASHPRVFTRAGMTIQVFSDAETACRAAADAIATAIRSAVEARGRAVLGLATGSTPIRIYARLVSLYRAGELSFAEVCSFNLDEYYPIHPSDPNSYRNYMNRHLFDHVDIAPNHAHILDGTVPEAFAPAHAAEFDRWIAAEGGLDLQLLGIGRNGHIGFNEPAEMPVAEMLQSRTRLTFLHPVTIADAAHEFGGESRVIRRALTLGVSQILAARSIVILALGSNKSEAVARASSSPMTALCPASLLQTVPSKVMWMIDDAAARGIIAGGR